MNVRKHPAPKGALKRLIDDLVNVLRRPVRKHPAPKGALRQLGLPLRDLFAVVVRNHPAPKGALRLPCDVATTDRCVKSESTQHQKAY